MSRPAHDYSSWFNIPLCNHSFFYPKKIMTLQRSAETGAYMCAGVCKNGLPTCEIHNSSI